MPFDDFVRFLADCPDSQSDPHWQSQTHLLSFEGKLLPFDFVGRFENLEADWLHICDHLGIESYLPQKHISTQKGQKEYYTKQTVQMITKRYQLDIENFGYEI